MQSRRSLAALLLLFASLACADDQPDKLDPAALEASGVVIGKIILNKKNIFDLDNPAENKRLYRLANKYHVVTQDHVIERQLLVAPGEPFSQRLIEESERLLRSNKYLYDASITPVNAGDGTVDLTVTTRDVWTLLPAIGVSRKGGENKITIGLQDTNLLGRGQTLRYEYTDDVDRTANTFEFSDRHLRGSWLNGAVFFADNSDGHSRLLALARPFYALDTRWSAGGTVFDDDRRTALYDLGDEAAEFQHERQQFSLFGGWSRGLTGGWVTRYTAGFVFDDNEFGSVPGGSLPALVPQNRKLVYPFIGIELLQDQFETTINKRQIARTEDFFTGTQLTATLGWADESFDSDRDALVYTASYARGFGSLEKAALLVRASARGRLEDGDSRDVLARFDARYYRKQSKKRVFYATAAGRYGHDLDIENVVVLGGESGLRGYPLRYQNGESRFLATVEQRYYWDWYPFRIVRVGGAIFADVGRTWGESPLGARSDGWLRDAGIGLRFASTRTGGNEKVVHLDVAFPLDGDDSIDDVQFILETKRSF